MQNESIRDFTYHYKQPAEYQFSLDSIHLAQLVANELQSHPNLSALRVLDLCAGCGVIGIELSWHLPALRQIDFIEIQAIYTDYFYHNVANVNRPELKLGWHLLNYDELHNNLWKETFDVIISNPPYFHKDHGMLSPSQFKNRCRFYLDSSFENYILALANALSINGKAYFLLRPLKHHGMDVLSDVQKILQETAITVKKLATIRGTDVIVLNKTPFL